MANTKDTIKKPLDQVIGFILRAIARWRAENTEEVVQKKVTTRLDKNAEELTLKLLGFNSSWGEWSIDHCNGRAGESAIGDYLRKAQSVAIKEFFDSVDLKKVVTPAMKNRLIKIIQKEFEYSLDRAVRDAVVQHTEVYVNQIVADIAKSDDIENVLKTIKLIGTN